MRKILRFASLTLATQLVLLLQQLALLPAQIHFWDHGATAAWYEAISLAAITSVADLGLRGAGHADLLRLSRDPNDSIAQDRFRQIWAWVRILVGAVTVGVVLLCAMVNFVRDGHVVAWSLALILAGGLEAILTIRIIYLDSLGWYNLGESGYLIFAAARLIASLTALLIFGAKESALAAIYLISVSLALALQSIVCRQITSLRLPGGLMPKPSLTVLSTARHTFAGPLSSWIQIHFPVLVLSTIAGPVMVTAYVTLRAIFGVARQTVLQISRAASVEYVRLSRGELRRETEAVLSLLMIVIGCLGSWLACLVLVETQRLAHMIHTDDGTDFMRVAAATFGLAGSFLSYQIVMSVMMRLGNIAEIARRQYLYVCLSLVCAFVALVTGFPTLYLVLTAAAEIIMAILFLARPPYRTGTGGLRSGRRAIVAAAVSAGSVVLVWATCAADTAFSYDFPNSLNLAGSAAILAFDIAAIAMLQAFMNRDLRGLVPHPWRGRRA